MEKRLTSEDPLEIIRDSRYSVEDFVKRVSVNAKGNPLLGECLTYACVFSSIFEGDLFVLYIPDNKVADNPMHAASRIGSNYYDARGTVSRDHLICDQVNVIESDFNSYINSRDIDSISGHIRSNSKHISVIDARGIPAFNSDLYSSVYKNAQSEILRIMNGDGLSADITTERGGDF